MLERGESIRGLNYKPVRPALFAMFTFAGISRDGQDKIKTIIDGYLII